ncbi:MAG: hypothetical protein LUC83_04230 [Clostridiales bacterium]|nr:hypothetical protein [Clostridiales bacterium]
MQDADVRRSKEVYHSLSGKKKIQYIFEYYKVVVILIVIGIGILIYAVFKILHPDPEPVLGVALVEAATPTEDEEDVFDQFLTENGYNPEEDFISIEVMDYAAYTSPILITRMMAQTVDLLAADQDTVESLVEGGRLMELEDLLPESLLEEYSDNLYCEEDSQTGETHVYAVLLPEDNALTENGYYEDAVYIGIAYSAEHVEAAEAMMEYLLNE